jgi:hypothetical protein
MPALAGGAYTNPEEFTCLRPSVWLWL